MDANGDPQGRPEAMSDGAVSVAGRAYRLVLLSDPIFSLRKGAVVAHRLRPLVFEHVDGFSAPAELDDAMIADLSALDLEVLNRAVAMLHTPDDRARFALHVPVRLPTIGSGSGSRALIARLNETPPAVRAAIAFCLEGLHEGTPNSRIGEAVAALRPYCRGVIACAPRAVADIDHWSGVGVRAVSLDLAEEAFRGRAALIHDLRRFARTARHLAPAVIAESVGDAETAAVAAEAGFSHVCGAAVAEGALENLTAPALRAAS
ncbi:MAG: hypothetical protein JSR45_16650 [Proteobacteria bacterium]|nr:hypothetical protein [Pseudomonadota bacterium]